MRARTGQAKRIRKSLRASSRVRTFATSACSRAMRSAISGGGCTVFSGRPSMRSIAYSRRATSSARAPRVPSAQRSVSSTRSGASRASPNTTMPSSATTLV
jgi:hypothetical protein